MKPVIGITTRRSNLNPLLMAIKFSVWVSGGKPLPLRSLDTIETAKVDGLLLGGGTDVFPALFQNDNPKENYRYDHERDEMEIGWLRRAENENIPVLAICRGAQMMNVMHGGTLHMDVRQSYKNADYPEGPFHAMFYRKRARITPGSLLHRLMGVEEYRINSLHSQSIDQLGKDLNICAQEDNGVVQAIEGPENRFYLGVQFHPELMIYQKTMRQIFKGLMAAAKDRQATA